MNAIRVKSFSEKATQKRILDQLSQNMSRFAIQMKRKTPRDVKTEAVKQAGSHWYTMGLVSKSRARKYLEVESHNADNLEINFGKRLYFRPWHLPAFSSIQLIKSIYSLKYGSTEPDYVRDTGDFFGMFGSNAVWLYLHVTTVILTSFEVALPLLLKLIGRLDWLQTFGYMRQEATLDKLRISEVKSLKQFLQTCRRGFRLLEFRPYFFNGTIITMFLPGYLYKFGFGWHFLFVCLPSLVVLCGYITNSSTAFIAPVTYFSLYAYYVSVRLRLQYEYWLETKEFLDKFRSLKAARKHLKMDAGIGERNGHFNERIEQQYNLMKTACKKRITKGLAAHNAILADIALGDRFYSRLLLTALPCMYFTCLTMTYGLLLSKSWGEAVFFLCVNAGPFNISILYFLMSSRALAQLKRCYVSIARLGPVYVDFGTNWRLQGALERLAPRKFKPGFRCAYLFLLTRFNMFKVAMATTSFFFMMVQFGREVN